MHIWVPNLGDQNCHSLMKKLLFETYTIFEIYFKTIKILHSKYGIIKINEIYQFKTSKIIHQIVKKKHPSTLQQVCLFYSTFIPLSRESDGGPIF